MRISTILIAASLSLAGLPAAAQTSVEAGRDPDVPKVVVQFGDLDINHARGARILLQRVASAAAVACGGRPPIVNLEPPSRFQRCVRQSTATAVATINAPMVTALCANAPSSWPGIRSSCRFRCPMACGF